AGIAARHDHAARERQAEGLRLVAAGRVLEVGEAVAVVVDAVAADLGRRRLAPIVGGLPVVAGPALVALAVAARLVGIAVGVGAADFLVALTVATTFVGGAARVGPSSRLVPLSVAGVLGVGVSWVG